MLEVLVLLLFLFLKVGASPDPGSGDFTFNGFGGADLSLNGSAEITSGGLLLLTDHFKLNQIGHAFYSIPLSFKNRFSSFSTTFAFAILPDNPKLSGNGFAFVISPTKELNGALPMQYLGLFNVVNNGNSTNHIIAVEFDTIQNLEFEDINDNHIGLDVNGLKSSNSTPAGYYSNSDGGFKKLSLKSEKRFQAWIDYDDARKEINVTISLDAKPNRPLLSSTINISSVAEEFMYVGFSAATGTILSSHYILGWSFKMNGQASPLDLSRLPSIPIRKKKSKVLTVVLPVVAGVFIATAIIFMVVFMVMRKIKFAEVFEDWELQYGPQRLSYKTIYRATKGFKQKEVLGEGGFGKVYKGLLPTSSIQVAVKKISHKSEQGMKEFVAEIATIGRIRHPNLVRLLGYSRRKEELILVYDYMANSSMDKFLYGHPESTLSWDQRFQVIKNVASGLHYLHNKWTQVVLHRDIKASNVLLDSEFKGRLGDFGLSKLHDHGSDIQTTRLVGTIGYMAPELGQTGKATKATDVYAFGAFLLEVACGRRPMEPRASSPDKIFLADWVWECLRRGRIVEAMDPKLGDGYVGEEIEAVMKLGLLCMHRSPGDRPSMGQILEFLEREHPLPELPLEGLGGTSSPASSGPTEYLDSLITISSSSPDSSSIIWTGG